MKRIFIYSTLVVFYTVSLLVCGACNEDVDVEAIYITAAEETPVTTFSAQRNGDAMGITVSSSLIAETDIEAQLSIDNSLVSGYNSNHGENYQELPEGTCTLSGTSVVIQSGKHRSEAVKLVINDIDAVRKGVNFLLPVKVVSKNEDYPSLPGSDVLYVVINRTILTSVPKFDGTNCYEVKFNENDKGRLQNLEAFTMEARVSMWEFPKYYGGNLFGILGYPAEGSAWLFVDGTPDRVGGEGDVPVFMLGAKGWNVYAGKLGYTIEKETYYHVAGVYENNKLKLYINGELFVEADHNEKISFTKFYIGAAPGSQDGFYMKGYVSEARLWTRALSAQELRNSLHQCFTEVDSEGLEGYWKLDDASDVCQDYTGHGHTAMKYGSGEIGWVSEVPCP